MRSGLYLESESEKILVDASPDILVQLERASLSPHLDALILTHHHHDHVLGLGDLCYVRAASQPPLLVYAGPATQAYIRAAFANLLRPEAPLVQLAGWRSGQRLTFGDVTLEGFETGHRQDSETTGVVISAGHEGRRVRVAYATDMGAASPSARGLLEGVDMFFGDGTYLGEAGHGHPAAARTIEIARGLGARQIVLTHIGHWRVRRAEALSALPPDVAICRDGDDLLSFLE